MTSMISRRAFLKGIGALFIAGLGLGSYAFGIEPVLRMNVTRYRLSPPRWPRHFNLKIAVVADIHACEPWMTLKRIHGIVDATNALEADIILLLGDYVSGMRLVTEYVPYRDWSLALARLKAPLGVHSILGNHDWWKDKAAQRKRRGPTIARKALEGVGIPVYENDAVRLEKDERAFWLAGLGDQVALLSRDGFGRRRFRGVDDLPGTLAKVSDDAPVILLAHEPDIFPHVPDRVSLTLSGHTHGGQVRLFGYSPIVPSRYGNRFAYGHVVEEGRHLIVSGGLGMSILPVRFGTPPEILVVELGDASPA